MVLRIYLARKSITECAFNNGRSSPDYDKVLHMRQDSLNFHREEGEQSPCETDPRLLKAIATDRLDVP